MNPIFRVYISPDILGIELGGALKNVIALAAGTADGLGYGDNTKAALITRGIAEISVWELLHGSQSRYLLRAVRYRGFDCNPAPAATKPQSGKPVFSWDRERPWKKPWQK